MTMNPRTAIQSENKRLKTENIQLRNEVRRLRRFVGVLSDLSDIQDRDRSQGDGNVLALLDGVLRQALNLLDAPDGSLLLLDHESDELVFAIVHGTLGADLEDYRIPADEGIAGWVVQNAEAALVRDVRSDRRFFQDIDEKFRFQTLSVAAAPLFGDGRVIGVIEALNKPGDTPFSETDMTLLKLLCRFAGEALAHFERE